MSAKHDDNSGYARDVYSDRRKVSERRERERRQEIDDATISSGSESSENRPITHPHALCPVRVVLSNGEDDELDLGVFNQGVRIDPFGALFDVASSTKIAVYRAVTNVGWVAEINDAVYHDLFVHGAREAT